MLEIIFLLSGIIVLAGGVLILKDCIRKSDYKDLGTSVGMLIYGVIAIILSLAHIF